MPDLWTSSCLRLSASSLFLHSRRRLFCSTGGLGLDRIVGGSKALRVDGSFAAISGFKVHSSGRFRSLYSAADRLVGRWAAAAHFDYASTRRAPHRSWVATPRPLLLTVRISVRSLKADHGWPESELELENPFRSSRQAAFANRSVKTVKKSSSSSRKAQKQRNSEEDELSASAEGRSKRVGVNPKTQVSGGQDERSGSESFDGRGASLRGVNNSSKQFGGKFVVVGSDIPKPNTPNPNGKLSRARNFLKRSRVSRVASTSATVVQDLPGGRKGVPKVPPAASSAMNLNQNSSRRKQAGDESKTRQHKEKRPKKKDFPPATQLRRDLNNCSKDGDVLQALDIYERSVSEGVVMWNQYNFNILLYLCSSAALGTLTARKSGSDRAHSERLNLKSADENLDGTFPFESANGVEQQDRGSDDGEAGSGEVSTTIPINLSPEVMELAGQRGFEIFEDMKKQGVPPNEATLTAVARLAVKKEDGDLAFHMVKEMAAQNIAPKLRSYSPALVTFCKRKAVRKAFEVDAHMVAAGVQPEEPELGALLQLCVEERLDKEVYSLLHRLRARVRALSPSTISSIEEWFSGQARSAGEGEQQPDVSALHHAMVAGGGGWHGLGWLGKGEWKLDWTTIDSDGFCRSCKNKLVTIDLDSKETDNFAQSVAELAFARETKPNDFRRFQDWLELNGPFDAIIDGANVGLYNQNFQQGGFNFFQVNSVAQTALDLGLVKRPPLIILHHARTKFGAANSSSGQQFLKKWSSSNTLYTTPYGSNDDWYWMYAAVRNKCLLITNDEMRDHLFQLLGSDFFPKWKERHQVRFSVDTRGPQIHLPPPYSLVIQESENGSWHIPKDRGSDVDAPHEWICVTRSGKSVDNAALPVSGLTTIPPETVARPPQTPHENGGQGSDSHLSQT